MERNILVLEKRFNLIDFYKAYGSLPVHEVHEIIRKLFLVQATEILEKEIGVATIYHRLDVQNGEKIFRICGNISFD